MGRTVEGKTMEDDCRNRLPKENAPPVQFEDMGAEPEGKALKQQLLENLAQFSLAFRTKAGWPIERVIPSADR